MRTSNFYELAARIDPDAEYSRAAASAAMGVNSNGFARLVKSNSVWIAMGGEVRREGKRHVYRGIDLINHLHRLDDWYLGARLACDFRELSGDKFMRKYGRSKGEVFGPGTYLAQMNGWRSAEE